MAYLLVYKNQAQDWDTHSHRLGFEGAQLLSGFRPQWHHIFPKKYLEGKVDENLINALANIAVIGPQINIRISARSPMDYIERYEISALKLSQQFVTRESLDIEPPGFNAWLNAGSDVLANAANDYLSDLRPSIAY
jgi:hypothetical protein